MEDEMGIRQVKKNSGAVNSGVLKIKSSQNYLMITTGIERCPSEVSTCNR